MLSRISRIGSSLTPRLTGTMTYSLAALSKNFGGIMRPFGNHVRYLSSTSTQDTIAKGIEKPKANTKELGNEAKEILKYCQYLYLEIVPYELFQKIVPDQVKLDRALKELTGNNLSLMKLNDNLYFSRESTHPKPLEDTEQARILANLLEYILDLFPLLLTYNKKDLEIAGRFRDCAKVIASKVKKEITAVNSDPAPQHYISGLGKLQYLLGNYCRHTRANTEAIRCYNDSLEMSKRLHPGNHISVAKALNDLGNTHLVLGDSVNISHSLSYFDNAYDMLITLSPPEYGEIARTLNNMGTAYAMMKGVANLTNALNHFKKALDIREKILSENHPDIAATLSNIGSAYADLGGETNCNISIIYHERAVKIFKSLYPANTHDMAKALNNMAVAYAALGDKGKALEYYKQVYSILLTSLGETHSETQQVKRGIERVQPDFFKRDGFVQKVKKVGSESRKVILSHGDTTGDLISLKQRIQGPILDEVAAASQAGYESGNWRGYYDIWTYLDSKLKPEIAKLGTDPKTLHNTKMLCFEAMCLGIMGSPLKPFRMVEIFCRTNTDLVRTIAEEYPQSFVDGSIVEACIRAVPHDKGFGDFLKENVKYAKAEVELTKAEGRSR